MNSMRRMCPRLPDDVHVVGFLYEFDDPALNGEDMLDAVLPNGILVSAGWYPEGDPQGCYRVTVSEGFVTLAAFETDSIADAAAHVQRQCYNYQAGSYTMVSDASVTREIVEV